MTIKLHPPYDLPLRAILFLGRHFHQTEGRPFRNSDKFVINFTAADVAKMQPGDFDRIPNFGKQSLAAIAAWLQREGYEPPFERLRCPCCGQEIWPGILVARGAAAVKLVRGRAH